MSNAVWDHDEQRWVADAEIAEITFTAFTGHRNAQHITARLIVRRVLWVHPATVSAGQWEMFSVHRYHAVSTGSPNRCSTLRPPTTTTPSSNKSSPTNPATPSIAHHRSTTTRNLRRRP
jgi:hypothetical protein